MKKKKTILLLLIMLLLFFLSSGCNQKEITVDNITPILELQTAQYNQEQFYTLQAIFYAQQPFHNVSVGYLCDYEGIEVKFKRCTDSNEFYYVLQHGEVKCFIFTDETDDVCDILVARDMPSIEETKTFMEKQNLFDFEFPDYYYYTGLSLDISSAKPEGNYVRQYFLCDGILIEEKQNNGANDESTSYKFYSDEEWSLVADKYEGYTILPIDKE